MKREHHIPFRPPEPGRFKAISRWLSAAIPPETGENEFCIPEGWQRRGLARVIIGTRLRSFRDRKIRKTAFRGCRIAQPPANRSHPSGMIPAIAEVLSDMDAELAALEQRRDKTRDLKQGMMQALLTGQTRLV